MYNSLYHSLTGILNTCRSSFWTEIMITSPLNHNTKLTNSKTPKSLSSFISLTPPIHNLPNTNKTKPKLKSNSKSSLKREPSSSQSPVEARSPQTLSPFITEAGKTTPTLLQTYKPQFSGLAITLAPTSLFMQEDLSQD